MRIDYEARARALVGMRFRPQGRGTEGLDCVGVLLATFGLPADCVRSDYRSRGNHGAEARQALSKYFRRLAPCNLRPGDLLMLGAAKDQLHFAVSTAAGFVHAHAGLRRVVETPGEPSWPIIGIYRRRARA